jgi:molecular chaperone IbpA
MYDLFFSTPRRKSFSTKDSMKHEVDLINTAFDLLNAGASLATAPSFPKHNSYRMMDGNPYVWFMEFALAGYEKSSLSVRIEGENLVISSISDKSKRENKPKDQEYFHRGIAQRDFCTKFFIGKDTEVKSAKFTDGLLTVELEKLVPDEPKPSSVKID